MLSIHHQSAGRLACRRSRRSAACGVAEDRHWHAPAWLRSGTVAESMRGLRALAGVDPDIGLMTHFADSDVFDGIRRTQQIERFRRGYRRLAGAHARCPTPPAARLARRRVGTGCAGGLLYGFRSWKVKPAPIFGFRPAMTLVHTPDCDQSYHNAANASATRQPGQCPEDMALGVAAIGYGDGYPRSAPSGTPVLVGGQRAPLIGRVSMDLITIDLRGAPHAQGWRSRRVVGSELPVEEIAARAGTISYDLTCGMTDVCCSSRTKPDYGQSQNRLRLHRMRRRAFNKWQGQCDECGVWNTLSEFVVSHRNRRRRSNRTAVMQARSTQPQIVALTDVAADRRGAHARPASANSIACSAAAWSGSVVLIGGDPGIGKSTLLLQVLGALAYAAASLYVTGEESLAQVACACTAAGSAARAVASLAETCIERILGAGAATRRAFL